MATRGTKLTYKGIELLTQCQTGKELHFSKVVLGDGSISEDQDVRQLTGIVSPKLTLPIKSITINGVGTVTMETELKNQDLAAGFFSREVGIFATGSDGTEILYAYRNTGADSEYIPAGGGSEVWDMIYDVVTVIDQAENVTATINGDIAYVTRVDFKEHTQAANHPYFADDVTTTDKFWVNSNDKKIHGITTEDARKVILGDSASTIPVLRSRVNQLETELDNVSLKLVAANEAPDSNLILAEDFQNPDLVDMFAVKVTSIVAGNNGIDIETDSGILTGAWYRVSDGLKDEYIQIKSVIKNGAIYRVLSYDNIKNTYDMPHTYIYRTTVGIGQQTISTTRKAVIGSNDSHGKKIETNIKWTGRKGSWQGEIGSIAKIDGLKNNNHNGDIVFLVGTNGNVYTLK